MRTFRALAAAAAAASLLLFAGCSGAGTSASLPEDEPVAGAAPADGEADASRADGSAATVPDTKPGEIPSTVLTQQLARTARVSLTVTDVEGAAIQLRQLATSMGGQVSAENIVTRSDTDPKKSPTSTMVISVPADHLDATLDQLKSVGSLTNRVVSSEDVTTQVADVDSRIRTLNGSILRLRELSRKAGSIRELTELESQLTERIAERDSLVAQQRSLAGRVAQSPITIVLTLPAPAADVEPVGFIAGLVAGWNALLSSSRALMTLLGAILPFAALGALIVVPVLLWRRRRRRAGRSNGKPAAPAATPGRDDAGR